MLYISQNSVILYLIFVIFIFLSLNSVKSLYKFFFITEIFWIILFLFLLSLENVSNSNNLTVNALFILVFTGIEALIIASIFLINSRTFTFKI